MSMQTLHSVAEHDALLRTAASTGALVVLLFSTAWHPPAQQMRSVLATLASAPPAAGILFADVDAEGVADVTELYSQVESVPTTILLRGGVKEPVATLEGANAAQLTQLVTQHSRAGAGGAAAALAPAPAVAAAASASGAAAGEPESKEALHARLGALVKASPVMAFIKGTPAAPRCGFTKQLLALLTEQGVQFGSFDILSDSAVREGLKSYSNWPTYPQLYVSGELLGGLDIVKELVANGEFAGMIPAGHLKPKDGDSAAAPAVSLEERLKALVRQRRVMLFMKGSPAAPQCGFSRKVVALLEECGCSEYGTFDILTDNEVREGLKKFSNWPTYPQLYVDGELVGGLDVLTELKESGELKEMLEQPPPLEPKQ